MTETYRVDTLVSNLDHDVLDYASGSFRSSRFSLPVSFLRDCNHQSAANSSSTAWAVVHTAEFFSLLLRRVSRGVVGKLRPVQAVYAPYGHA